MTLMTSETNWDHISDDPASDCLTPSALPVAQHEEIDPLRHEIEMMEWEYMEHMNLMADNQELFSDVSVM
jgi:hypothetical protein